MVLEEVWVAWFLLNEFELHVGVVGAVEGRSAEGDREEKDAEGEDVGNDTVEGHHPSLQDLWGHVRLRTKNLYDWLIHRRRKSKITEFELSIV